MDHETTTTPPQQVLVVGAGPVGLVAACELARHGIVARVVEALDEPTTQSRAVGVQPRAQELLAVLGVLEQVEALALPQDRIEIDLSGVSETDEPLLRIDVADLPTRHPRILNLPQTAVEQVLRERAAELGVAIERGVRLTGLTQDDDGVDVVLQSASGDEHARVDWVVGADGGHSATRGLSGSALHGQFHGTHFAMGDVQVESPFDRTVTRLFASTHGMTVMLCMRDRTRLMFQVPDPGPDSGAGPTLELLQELAHERMGTAVRVTDPTWLTYYSVHHAQIPQYRLGRVLLAGDAAHLHSPAAGQGMNTGMQDAANLAWKLALVCRGQAGAGLLDSYHDERHPVGAEVVRKATAMTDSMSLTGVAAHLRNTAMRSASHLDGLTRAVATNLAELSVTYRHSGIVERVGHHRLSSVRPGDFADRGLDLRDGGPGTVEDLLQAHPGHLLLAGTDDPDQGAALRSALGDLGSVVPIVTSSAALDAAQVFVDPDGTWLNRAGLGRHGMALVRPDGYLGLLSSSCDPQILTDHLHRVLHP